MLTLGLMEGAFAAIGGALFFLIALNEGAPLHKLIAPPVGALLGFTAYTMVTTERAIDNGGQVLGLITIGVLAFAGPIAFYAWAARELRKPVAAAAPKPVAVERPVAAARVIDVTEPAVAPARADVMVRPLQRTKTPTKA